MKILFLVNSPTGLYKFRRELIDALAKEHEITISTPDGDFIEYFKEKGCSIDICSILDGRSTDPVREIKLISYYRKLIKREKPDMVFTYTIKPNCYGGYLCGKKKIPYVANITGLGVAVENAGILQRATSFLYRKGLKHAQKVFFQNTENLDFMLSHHIVSGAYDLLPGSGVNLTDYPLMDYPVGDKTVFMFISRVLKEKGIDQYLDAAKAIRLKYPNTEFHVCGSYDDQYSQLLKELHDSGTIICHGPVRDIAEMHRINCCTIHPTFYPEGMSNVLLESCACGRPIITTDRPGCREIVDDGVNGFVVKQRDSADLIEKIEKFLSLSWEERRQMGLAGRDKVEKEFDRNIVIDKYLKEIQL